MRAVLLSVVVLGGMLTVSGCSSSTPEIPRDTIAYDKARDGEPQAVGPGGKGAPGKGGKGAAAPSK
jgi:hypothetical protein